MDSLKDILIQKDMDEPTELTALKEFIAKEYDLSPKITINPKMIVVYMPSAAQAATLRMRYREIQKYCQLTRKLYIRIR